MSFLDIALRNAARGFRVHPLKPRDKAPLLPGWPDQATNDPETIYRWANACSTDCNVGVCADDRIGICILESDASNQLMPLLTHDVPDCYTVQARNFRPHWYFLQTDATRDLGNCDLPGIFEFKQRNRYVVAEGSTHPTGPEYLLVQDRPLFPMPDWLVADLKRLYGERKRKDAQPDAGPIGYGGRHDFLTSVAGKLRNSGLNADAILAALIPINEARCQPPIPAVDVEHIAQSVGRYAVPEPEPKLIIGKQPAEPSIPAPPVDWRTHYHTFDEMDTAPPTAFLIDGFLPDTEITAIAAPVGQRKSLVALNVAHALCTKEPLFGHFEVTKQPSRVLYLCPEMGIRSFTERVRAIGLMEYVGKTLFCRTMSAEGTLDLKDLQAEELQGAVLIIDTAIRYLEGDESSSEDMKRFAAEIFRIMKSGAAAVMLLHHSAKGTKESSELTLENAMRGSGELGAFLSSCWATRLQNPESPYDSASYLTNVKQRNFKSLPFEITSDENCKLTLVPESWGKAVLNQAPAVKPGEADAVQIVRDNEKESLRVIVEKLKAAGVPRGKDWVSTQKYRLVQERGGPLSDGLSGTRQ